MTVKCWTTTTAIGQPPATTGTTGQNAAPGSASTSANTVTATIPMLLPGARSAAANITDLRRRSVGFINTSPSSATATSPLVTTPSRNPNVHKTNRIRSLSSTWEATDIDDEESLPKEEKSSGVSADHNRREAMFTQLASSLNNQHDALVSGHTPRRRGHHGSRSARNRRRRTMSESSGSTTSSSRRVRILTPVASKVCFGGWVRGQSAEVRWEVVDKSVQSVRIDVCNVAWSVPTTIANRVPNDGHFVWKRVYWGMPITEGYYVNIYDVTDISPEQLPSPDQQHSRPMDQPGTNIKPSNNQSSEAPSNLTEKTELVLLARSDCFSVVG